MGEEKKRKLWARDGSLRGVAGGGRPVIAIAVGRGGEGGVIGLAGGRDRRRAAPRAAGRRRHGRSGTHGSSAELSR
jgi:hypothetical protein